MIKKDRYDIAVIGATSLVGREVANVLRERQFPLATCRLFDTFDALADADPDDADPVEDVERADLRGVDLAFLCGNAALSRAWAPRGHGAGAAVIDLTQAFADSAEVPLVVPEVNPDAASLSGGRGIVASPSPGAIALCVVLNPLRAAGLRRVVVAGYESVSSAERAGIEELSRQTAELMNGRDTEVSVFPHRIAFNVIPQVSDFLSDGDSRAECEIVSQTRRVLSEPTLRGTATVARVPIFFGQGYAVNVELAGELSADAARSLLREAPGILLTDEPSTGGYPTVADALTAEAIRVGRVRRDPSVASGLNLWITIDGLRKGAAVNGVQIAELLVGHLVI